MIEVTYRARAEKFGQMSQRQTITRVEDGVVTGKWEKVKMLTLGNPLPSQSEILETFETNPSLWRDVL